MSMYDSSQYKISNDLCNFSLELSQLVTLINVVLDTRPGLASEIMTDDPPYEELEYLVRQESHDVPFDDNLNEVIRFAFHICMLRENYNE